MAPSDRGPTDRSIQILCATSSSSCLRRRGKASRYLDHWQRHSRDRQRGLRALELVRLAGWSAGIPSAVHSAPGHTPQVKLRALDGPISEAAIAGLTLDRHLCQHRLVAIDIVVNDDFVFRGVQAV